MRTPQAAYTVVAEASRTAQRGLAVRAVRSGDTLVVEVDTHDRDAHELVELEDRIGAIDGRLAVENRNGHVTIRAELPCGS